MPWLNIACHAYTTKALPLTPPKPRKKLYTAFVNIYDNFFVITTGRDGEKYSGIHCQ